MNIIDEKTQETIKSVQKTISDIQETINQSLAPTLEKIKEITKDINYNYIPSVPLLEQEHFLTMSQNLAPISQCGDTLIIILKKEA